MEQIEERVMIYTSARLTVCVCVYCHYSLGLNNLPFQNGTPTVNRIIAPLDINSQAPSFPEDSVLLLYSITSLLLLTVRAFKNSVIADLGKYAFLLERFKNGLSIFLHVI